MKKKIFVLVPDGVSLRNFAYTSFYSLGINKGYDVVFWNATPFDLNNLGFSTVQLQNPRPHWLSDVQKTACKKIELDLFAKRNHDPIYYNYDFPLRYLSIKETIKSLLVTFYSKWYASERGLLKIRNKIIKRERQTDYYRDCLSILKAERPDFVFCTSQRSVIAIAPLTAAQDIGINTASFIFSWDNVPKATTVITTDYYFVWSEHMKQELLKYQQYIKPEQIKVTGTPQFENHFTNSLVESKAVFFERHGLDIDKKYICFSGDDITTSPADDLYLRDIAAAVRDLNEKGHNLGIIFRRCPVDFSGRYGNVLEAYKDVIIPIEPSWEKIGEIWNTILPMKADLALQTNIIAHTSCVVNLGSSMVFDYACYHKPCAFVNYNYLNPSKKALKGVYVYNYVHFRSMPSKKAVVWFSNPESIADDLQKMLEESAENVIEAKNWFEKINMHPPQDSSARIWENIENLIRP